MSLSMPLTELLRSPSRHGPFPSSILQGMQSPSGANLESVQQLDDFIHHFFVFQLPKNFFIQMAIAGTWITLLLVMGSYVILDRTRKGAFWIFKFQRRSEGIYIVPNALNTFLLFEGLYGIMFVAFVIVQYRGYWLENPSIQYHIGVFNLIIWWPLWIGAFMAGWGSFYTAPGALDKGPLSSSRIGKLAPRPLIINIFCLGTPIVLLLSLVAPIVLTQRQFNSAFDAYRSFHQDLFSSLNSSPNQLLSPTLALQYLDRASLVWTMQTKSAWYLSIGYGVWPIWAGLFLIFYIPAGGYLCYMVWNQLRRQRVLLMEMEANKREVNAEDKAKEAREAREASQRHHSEALLFQPLTSSQQRREEEVAQLMGGQGRLLPPATNRDQGEIPNPSGEEDNNSSEQQREIFFPPLRPEVRKRVQKRMNVIGTPRARYNYLRRCFINLTILFVAIVLGAALYLGIAAALARSLYESYLHDPLDCTNVVYNTCLVAAWGAVVFGSLSFFAILARLFDPANSRDEETMTRKKKSPSPSRLLPFLPFRSTSNSQSQSHTLTDSQQNKSLHQREEEKTRTLPAVPESVGATFDDPLQSTGTFSSSLSPSKNLARGLKNGINFHLQKKQGGGLILQPAGDVVGATSTMTSIHSLQESLQDEVYNGTATSYRKPPRFFPQDMTQGGSLVEEEEREELQSTIRSNIPRQSIATSTTTPMSTTSPKKKKTTTPLLSVSKPLAPERSPPLSPVYLKEEESSSSAPRRRNSEWDLQQQQHHHQHLHHHPGPLALAPARRASEAGLEHREKNRKKSMVPTSDDVGALPLPLSEFYDSQHRRHQAAFPPPSSSSNSSSPSFRCIHLSSRRASAGTTTAIPDALVPPSGPIPPTPSTASTANFPITPNVSTRSATAAAAVTTHNPSFDYHWSLPPRRGSVPLVVLQKPPMEKRRNGSLDPVSPLSAYPPYPMGLQASQLNRVSSVKRFSPGVFF